MFFFRPKRKHVDMVVVGLGNPGPRYSQSRHNLGYAVVNKLAKEWTTESSWRQGLDYVYLEGQRGGKACLLLKPTTFMNLSGNAIRKAGRKFTIQPENLLIIHDDLDVAYGKVKFKFGGSPAGHKGVSSVAGRIGTYDFYHLKMGIGMEGIKTGEHYVLEQLDEAGWAAFTPAIDVAWKGLEVFISRGPDAAAQFVNTHGKLLGEDINTGQDTSG